MPFAYNITLTLKNYEIIVPINQHNFVDSENIQKHFDLSDISNENSKSTEKGPQNANQNSNNNSNHKNRKKSGENPKNFNSPDGNACLALVGKELIAKMTLPYDEFQPTTVNQEYSITGKDVRIAHSLAETDPMLPSVLALKTRIFKVVNSPEYKQSKPHDFSFNDIFFPNANSDLGPPKLDKMWTRYTNTNKNFFVFAFIEDLDLIFGFNYGGKIKNEVKPQRTITFDETAGGTGSCDSLSIYINVNGGKCVPYPTAIDQAINLRHCLFGFYDSVRAYGGGQAVGCCKLLT